MKFKITLLLAVLALLATTTFAQRLKTDRLASPKARCYPVSVPQEPRLDDYPTYRDYAVIDAVSMGFESINNQWVEGRIYLTATVSYVGAVDEDTTHYVEPVDGTTPIDGGHAFTADWYLLVTVNQYSGLIVQSPYGNWSQGVAYNENDFATVRVTLNGSWLRYSLDGVEVFSQYAPDLVNRDWRAYYIGTVDNLLIGVRQLVCGDFTKDEPAAPKAAPAMPPPCRETPRLFSAARP